MSDYLTHLRNHIDNCESKPFEQQMRRAEMFEELFQYAKELQEELGNANYKLSRSNWMEGTRTEGYVGEHGSIVNVFVAPQ